MEENQSFENVVSPEPPHGPGEDFEEVVENKDFQGYFSKVRHGLSREIEAESRAFTFEQLKSLSVKLDDVAEVLANTAMSFRDKKKAALADMVEVGSEGVSSLSRQLREKYTEKMAIGVEDLVRNRFWILLGGAFAAGVLLWGLSSRKEFESLSERAPGDLSKLEEQPYGPH